MGNAEYMGRRGRTAKRKTTTKGNKKERKKSTKTKGGKVEVMASFGIFLHLAILCFFIKSKVHGKHFLIATEGDVDEGDTNANAIANGGGDGACGNAVATGVSGVIKATARCVCHCPSPGWRNNIVIAVAKCQCVCNGIEGPYGRCEEED